VPAWGRARLEGRHIGRKPLELDRSSILRDRELGQSLGQLAKAHHPRGLHEPAPICEVIFSAPGYSLEGTSSLSAATYTSAAGEGLAGKSSLRLSAQLLHGFRHTEFRTLFRIPQSRSADCRTSGSVLTENSALHSAPCSRIPDGLTVYAPDPSPRDRGYLPERGELSVIAL
jgi:hypothetical protein